MTDCPDWCNDHSGPNPRHHRSTQRRLITGMAEESIALFGADHNKGIELFEHGASIELMGLAAATAVREEFIRNAAAQLNAAAVLGRAIEEVWS